MYGVGVMAQYAAEHFTPACLGMFLGRGEGGRKGRIQGGRKREGWLSVGVIAQWQSTGSLSQRTWVRLPAAPLFILSLPFARSSDSNSLDCL